jgi:hypothetical protein
MKSKHARETYLKTSGFDEYAQALSFITADALRAADVQTLEPYNPGYGTYAVHDGTFYKVAAIPVTDTRLIGQLQKILATGKLSRVVE